MYIRIQQSFTTAQGTTYQCGQKFEANDSWADELIDQGLARREALPPSARMEQPSRALEIEIRSNGKNR